MPGLIARILRAGNRLARNRTRDVEVAEPGHVRMATDEVLSTHALQATPGQSDGDASSANDARVAAPLPLRCLRLISATYRLISSLMRCHQELAARQQQTDIEDNCGRIARECGSAASHIDMEWLLRIDDSETERANALGPAVAEMRASMARYMAHLDPEIAPGFQQAPLATVLDHYLDIAAAGTRRLLASEPNAEEQAMASYLTSEILRLREEVTALPIGSGFE